MEAGAPTVPARLDRRCSTTASGLSEVWPDNLCPIAQFVEIVGPMLHHAHAFVPIFSARVDSACRIRIEVSKLPLDRIGVPQTRLVEESGGCRTESMRRHLLAAVA